MLVGLHRLLALGARRSHALGILIKGRSDVLIRDGVLDDDLARRRRLSEHDVLEDVRLHGNVEHIGDVALGVFERNGHITVVPKQKR